MTKNILNLIALFNHDQRICRIKLAIYMMPKCFQSFDPVLHPAGECLVNMPIEPSMETTWFRFCCLPDLHGDFYPVNLKYLIISQQDRYF